MEGKNHGSPSFVNVAALLLFAIVIAAASAVTTYFILNSRSNEQYSGVQPSVLSPPQTYIQPTSPPVETIQIASDETASWKVYRNEKYGFWLKYPDKEGWGVQETKGLGDSSTVIFFYDQGIKGSLTLTIVPQGTVDDEIAYWKNHGLTSIESFETNQLTGKKLIIGNWTIVYLFSKSNNLPYFAFGAFASSKTPELLGTATQILSTFKFLE